MYVTIHRDECEMNVLRIFLTDLKIKKKVTKSAGFLNSELVRKFEEKKTILRG